MKKRLLTIISILLAIIPFAFLYYKGFHIMLFEFCFGLGAILLLYAYSAKQSLLHRFMGWMLVAIGAYCLLIVPVRALQTPVCHGVEFVVAYALTYWLCRWAAKKDMNPVAACYAVIVSLLFLELPLRVIDFEGTAITLPGFLLYIVAALLAWLQFRRKKRVWVGSLTVIFSLFTVFYVCKGDTLWRNYLSFGTFTGRIERSPMPDFSFLDEQGDTVKLSHFRGRKVLVDCWSKGCGVCLQKMPLLQQVHEQYKGSKVYVTSLFVTYRGNEPEEGAQIVREEGYTFPVWTIDEKDSFVRDLNITSFPIVLLFDEEGALVFYGRLEDVGELLDE